MEGGREEAGQHGRCWTDLGGYSGTFLPQMQLFFAVMEGGREEAGQHGRCWTDLGGYSGTFLPQMQLFFAVMEGGREEGRLAKESVRASLGEVLVAKALYKSRDSHRWEAITVRNLLQ